jgi:hypothetical protein
MKSIKELMEQLVSPPHSHMYTAKILKSAPVG